MRHSNRFGSWSDAAFVVAVLIVVAGTLVHVSYYFPRTVDDLFISLRYADRFVDGLGLTYNDGQRVEGFSNPTWVFAQSALIAVGLEGVLATKLLGLASLGGLQVVGYLYARRVFESPRLIALLPPALIGASGYLLSWSVWGLETPLFLLLLLALPLILIWCIQRPGWLAWSTTAAFVTVFTFTRPEAGLYVLTVGLAVTLVGLGKESTDSTLKSRLSNLIPAAVMSAVAVGAGFLLRKSYYGLWLPHTYYAKQGSGFSISKLLPLVGEGASTFEVLFVCGGSAIIIARLAYERRAELLALLLSCLFFVASVEVDWMPNQRHLLPVHLVVMLAWTWLATKAWEQRDNLIRSAAIATVVMVVCTGTAMRSAQLDVRFSPSDFRTHGGGERWVRPKSMETWEDAFMSLRGEVPSHAFAKFQSGPGMIGQLFYLIESSSQPEETSWYIGRDIGRVGYYSPVQVFDTPGLFTPAAIHSGEHVPVEAKREAFDRDIAAAELLGAWWPPPATIRDRYEYEGRRMRPKDEPPPSREQLLERYRRVGDAFPTAFTMATLYGESVGGIVKLRVEQMKEVIGRPVVTQQTGAADERPIAVLENGALELLRCELPDHPTTDNRPIYPSCYWTKQRAISRDFQVFVHLERRDGPGRFQADHAFGGGLFSLDRWPAGDVVRDTFAVVPGPDTPRGTYDVWMGLWNDRGRATVLPSPSSDDGNRVRVGTVEVRRR